MNIKVAEHQRNPLIFLTMRQISAMGVALERNCNLICNVDFIIPMYEHVPLQESLNCTLIKDRLSFRFFFQLTLQNKINFVSRANVEIKFHSSYMSSTWIHFDKYYENRDRKLQPFLALSVVFDNYFITFCLRTIRRLFLRILCLTKLIKVF